MKVISWFPLVLKRKQPPRLVDMKPARAFPFVAVLQHDADAADYAAGRLAAWDTGTVAIRAFGWPMTTLSAALLGWWPLTIVAAVASIGAGAWVFINRRPTVQAILIRTGAVTLAADSLIYDGLITERLSIVVDTLADDHRFWNLKRDAVETLVLRSLPAGARYVRKNRKALDRFADTYA